MSRSQLLSFALSAAILAMPLSSASAQQMHHNAHAQQSAAPFRPALPGQDAFGAIQEIVQILESDPHTDWSKVDIGALHHHLIDMHEVTLNAVANERQLPEGMVMEVTGKGRTKDAIKRMLPAHARELTVRGWNVKTETLDDGVRLTVTSGDPKQITKIKALGFIGTMVQGAHHQPHHLMMARGEFRH